MNNYLKIFSVIILYILLLSGCTTQRPAALGRIHENKDTVYLKNIFVNNPLPPIEVPKAEAIHDTLRFYRETILPSVPYLDTALLGVYLATHNQEGVELLELRKTILALQTIVEKSKRSDSQNTRLQQRLDTTTEKKKNAEELNAANEKIRVDVPLYLALLVALIALYVFLRNRYLERKLKKKQHDKIEILNS